MACGPLWVLSLRDVGRHHIDNAWLKTRRSEVEVYMTLPNIRIADPMAMDSSTWPRDTGGHKRQVLVSYPLLRQCELLLTTVFTSHLLGPSSSLPNLCYSKGLSNMPVKEHHNSRATCSYLHRQLGLTRTCTMRDERWWWRRRNIVMTTYHSGIACTFPSISPCSSPCSVQIEQAGIQVRR